MFWKELLSSFVQEFMVYVLPPLAIMLLTWLGSLIAKLWGQIRLNTDDRFKWILDAAVNAGVKAAEQMKLSAKVEDKKEYAMGVAQVWLAERGFKNIKLEILDAAIEAAVLDNFNWNKVNQPLSPTK